MRASGRGSGRAVPPRRRPWSSNQPSGWVGGANHQKDCLLWPSPRLARRMRGAPSTVRPFRTSTLAGMVEKPDRAWLSSLRVAALAPVGARLAARVELLAFMTLTEPATTVRAPGPADVALGRLETRSSSPSVAPGASL